MHLNVPGVLPLLPAPTNVATFPIILDNTVNILIHTWTKRVGSLKSLKFPLKYKAELGNGKA